MSSSQTPTYDALRPKERAFVDAYIEHGFNATKAGRKIKLKDPRRRGSELRTKQDISRAIDERLREGRASADMVRARLEEQAFASAEDILSFDDQGVARLDLNKARRRRKLLVVAKIKERSWFDERKQATVKEIEVETYSAQTALLALGKGFGLFEKEPTPQTGPQNTGVMRVPGRAPDLTAWAQEADASRIEP